MTLPLDQVRELLGAAAEGKTDDELVELRARMERLSRALIAAYRNRHRKPVDTRPMTPTLRRPSPP